MSGNPSHSSDAGRPDPAEPDPFEDALSSAPPPPPIPEVLTRPVDRSLERSTAVTGLSKPEAGKAMASMGGIGKAWGMAMDFVFTIVAAVGLGYVASIWLGYRQTWVLGGLGVGFALALLRILRTTMREEAREQAQRKANG